MFAARQTAALLSREHRDTRARLARVERAVRGSTGPAAEAEAIACVRALLADLQGEIARHFAFEERELFPRMLSGGEGDLAEVLGEEHLRIRGTASALATLLGAVGPEAARAQALAPVTAAQFRSLSLELVERLTAHIDKEEAAFPSLLEGLLDETTDRELALAHGPR
jgi:hemerythrin-like domain-containing protein